MSARDEFLRCIERGVGVYRYCSPSIEGHCWDCSGYVSHCFGVATGQHITADSHRQYELGRVVSGATQPGDLLFFNTGYSYRGNPASHVSVYVGSGQHISALNEDAGIVRGPVDTDYWRPRRLGSRRWFDDNGNALNLSDAPQEPLASPPDQPGVAGRPGRNGERGRRRFLRRMAGLVKGKRP